MVKIENKNACILSFSSIGEFLNTAEKAYFEEGDSWTYGDDNECNNREKTYSLLRAGKGLSSIRKLSKKYRHEFENSDLNEIMSRIKSIKRTRKFNDFSGNLDLDRIMSGDPNFWEKIERTGKSQVVRIGINFALSTGNSIKDFSRMVALSAVFAEILEGLGYGVEIYGAGAHKKHRKQKRKTWIGCLIPIKSATEPLDFDRIYSLGLPALLRDAYFRVEDHVFGCHGGLAESPPQEMVKLADVDVLITKSWTGENQVEKIIQVIENL